VEPIGVKVKPTDNQLVELANESKSMDPTIVGSLLLSKIEVNYPFMVKAKSLYAIEYLVKKNPTFLKYFKSQNHLFEQFPPPEDNVDSYKKILKNLLNVIGVTLQTDQQSTDSHAISFVDPGYNNVVAKPVKQ
jgi:hypothetical protein